MGQLPEEYITKVSYHEKKEVAYSLPSEATLNWLTYRELAEYHGYMQFYRVDEYVDLEGEVLLDQNFIEEYQVRDDWMKGYSRIIIGKNNVDVFYKDSSLAYSSVREASPADVFLDPIESLNYGFLDLKASYFDSLIAAYSNLGLQVNVNGNSLVATSPFLIASFDNTLKIASATEYDSFGIKTKETVIEYALNHSGETYFPETETVYEWVTTDSGCCVRIVTTLKRYEYTREVTNINPERIEKGRNSTNDMDLYKILTEENRDVFRIDSEKNRKKELEIIVYDIAGKIVMHTHVLEGDAVHLPQASRKGMYIVHILSQDKKKPIVGKVIKTSSSNQF